ncbi:MAG: 50S ribosomal protein L6, partial [Chloroflexota bacterium]
MSRIGRLPIDVPKGVEFMVKDSFVHVKGPQGELEWTFSPDIAIKLENGQVIVERPSDKPTHRALHGTTRALINNMIIGVSEGFERVLEINGVGYRAELDGNDLVINVGFSHPVKVEAPPGITFEVEMKIRQIKIKGRDKQQVGQIAAEIR